MQRRFLINKKYFITNSVILKEKDRRQRKKFLMVWILIYTLGILMAGLTCFIN